MLLRIPHARTQVNTTLGNVASAAIGDATDKVLWKKSLTKVAFLKKEASIPSQGLEFGCKHDPRMSKPLEFWS